MSIARESLTALYKQQVGQNNFKIKTARDGIITSWFWFNFPELASLVLFCRKSYRSARVLDFAVVCQYNQTVDNRSSTYTISRSIGGKKDELFCQQRNTIRSNNTPIVDNHYNLLYPNLWPGGYKPDLLVRPRSRTPCATKL